MASLAEEESGLIKMEYTPFGRIAKETWLDQEGNPTKNNSGYAAVTYDYDLTNAARVEKYFNY